MSIESTHPKYDVVAPDWVVMRDTFAGSRTIKDAGISYLPATSGMLVDGMSIGQPGYAAYNAYRCRAEFPELVTDAILTLTSVLNRHPAEIQVPARLEPLLENITRKGETAQMLLRKIHEHQLLFGRYGLMADFAQADPFDGTTPLRVRGAPDLPHAVKWEAQNIINWDDDRFTEFGREQLNFLVLSETIQTRGNAGADIFNFEQERRFRVLFLSEDGTYTTYAERDEVRTPDVQPAFKGATLDEIPFVFIGSNDLNPAPDEIPLLGLGNLSLTIYRADADYRQALHAQAQETLVTIGDEGEESDEVEGTKADVRRIGVGASLDLPTGGDAKYIGPESRGMPEMRMQLENDRNRAEVMGSRLLENRGSQAESGDALRIRVSARTANLGTISHTAASGLENFLKICAKWVGADESQVKVTPNLDFTESKIEPRTIVDLMTAKLAGAPLSIEQIHENLREEGFTRLTFKEEMERIAEEQSGDFSDVLFGFGSDQAAGLSNDPDDDMQDDNPDGKTGSDDGDDDADSE